MPGIGIGIGIPFRRTLLEYPTQNLTGRYIQLSEGGDLINTLGGVSIPYVSGTGLDQIFNFGVLNDNIYDKGSYVGNSFGLPATYNFPYVNIYYDSTSATTRKYWKLKDFHYANILSQSLLVDDRFFLKAKATTNTSNVLASVSELLIYSIAQSSTNLTKLKTYIGIQDDFYGDNLIPAASSTFDTDGTSFWTPLRGVFAWNSGTKDATITSNGSVGVLGISVNSIMTIGRIYLIKCSAKSSNLTESLFFSGNAGLLPCNVGSLTSSYVIYSCDYAVTQYGNLRIFINNTTPLAGEEITFDNIEIKLKYQNYYAS